MSERRSGWVGPCLCECAIRSVRVAECETKCVLIYYEPFVSVEIEALAACRCRRCCAKQSPGGSTSASVSVSLYFSVILHLTDLFKT